MNITLIKALAALALVSVILILLTTMFARQRKLSLLLQLVGAGCLTVVALTHVCEALHLFPWMHWGEEHSIGHYLDLASAVLGLTLFPVGFLLHGLARRRA
jgi:predicted membrane channel-forming protein YqfA (hemolysin III family)